MKPFPLSNRSVQLLLVFIMVFLQSCAACRSGLRGGFEQHDLQGSDEDNLFAYSIEFPDGFRVEHDGDRPPKGKGELLSAVARITNTNIGSSVETHVTPLMGLVNSTTGESLVDDHLAVDDQDFVLSTPEVKPTVFAKPGNFLRVTISGLEDDVGCEFGRFSFVVRLQENITTITDDLEDPQACELGKNAALITITPGVTGSAIDSDPVNWVAYHETSRVVTNKGTVLAPPTAKVCAVPVN